MACTTTRGKRGKPAMGDDSALDIQFRGLRAGETRRVVMRKATCQSNTAILAPLPRTYPRNNTETNPRVFHRSSTEFSRRCCRIYMQVILSTNTQSTQTHLNTTPETTVSSTSGSGQAVGSPLLDLPLCLLIATIAIKSWLPSLVRPVLLPVGLPSFWRRMMHEVLCSPISWWGLFRLCRLLGIFSSDVRH